MRDYGAVASEYYDKLAHPTCYNFFRLSRSYIAEHLHSVHPGERVLEVGAGDSAAATILHHSGRSLADLEITDACEAMLAYSKQWAALGASLYVADATALPHQDASIDCVVASLADPYNTPTFWHSMARVLVPYGRAIVTLPSFEWASRFRTCSDPATFNTAEFVLRNGTRVRVPSLICRLADLVRMIERAGFAVVEFRSLGADYLPTDELSPKVRVFDGPFSSLVWGVLAIRGSKHVKRTQECRA